MYSAATVALNNLTIAHAGAFYGAIDNDFGSLTVTNSTFSDNLGYYYCGAICQFGGSLTISNSTFAGNEAEQYYGGAIDINGGTATVTNSTFSDNTAAFDGGAIANFATLTVTDSTFSGNSAASSGSSIYNSASATVINSILATSSGTNCFGVSNGGYNISYNSSGSDTSCGFGTSLGASDQTIGDNVNPLLNTLAITADPPTRSRCKRTVPRSPPSRSLRVPLPPTSAAPCGPLPDRATATSARSKAASTSSPES